MVGKDSGGADLALVRSRVAGLHPLDDEIPFRYVIRNILVIHADVVILLKNKRAHGQGVVHGELPPRYLCHRRVY